MSFRIGLHPSTVPKTTEIYRPLSTSKDMEDLRIVKEMHDVYVRECVSTFHTHPKTELLFFKIFLFPIDTLSPYLQQFLIKKGFAVTDVVEVPFQFEQTMQRISSVFFDFQMKKSRFKWEKVSDINVSSFKK